MRIEVGDIRGEDQRLSEGSKDQSESISPRDFKERKCSLKEQRGRYSAG